MCGRDGFPYPPRLCVTQVDVAAGDEAEILSSSQVTCLVLLSILLYWVYSLAFPPALEPILGHGLLSARTGGTAGRVLYFKRLGQWLAGRGTWWIFV